MDIVGRGFLAGQLRPIADRHPDVVALAAGVSWASSASDAEFAREAALVRSVADRCRADGRTLLFFSTASAGVYGADRPGREDAPAVPRNPYGAHKLSLERQVRDSGARWLVLRLAHLVGPGQPAHQLVPTLLRHVRAGEVTIQRDATRDLVAVGDVVAVIDGLLERGLAGETVNVASGTSVPVERVVDHVERRLGVRARRRYVAGGAAHLVAVDKLRTLLAGTLLAGTALPASDPGYYRRALDTYVDAEEVADASGADRRAGLCRHRAAADAAGDRGMR